MSGTPLWPAGHLPLKGGDQLFTRLSLVSDVAGVYGAPKLPISPLEGEMAGRSEGGVPARLSPISNAAGACGALKLPISPLEGEMAGRPEGGVSARLIPICGSTRLSGIRPLEAALTTRTRRASGFKQTSRRNAALL